MGHWRDQLEFEQCKPTTATATTTTAAGAGTTAASGMLMISEAHGTSRLNKSYMV